MQQVEPSVRECVTVVQRTTPTPPPLLCTLISDQGLPKTIPFIPHPQTSRARPVPYALVNLTRTWESAERKRSVMESQLSACATSLATSSIAKGSPSVSTSSSLKHAQADVMAPDTVVQVVDPISMVLQSALADRRANPITPLRFLGWQTLMCKHNLVHKYPTVLSNLQNGALISIPHIEHTFMLPNTSSVTYYQAQFQTILQREYAMQCHIGPYSKVQLEATIGPFQTSLLSIIPKPNKPGKFRLVQDFSFLHTPASPIPSINSAIDSSLHPCMWGTFSTMALCITRLPPGSQAATRDEAEAYRMIPLHLSQWNGTVTRVGDDPFNLDTCLAFGLAPSAGMSLLRL